MTNQLGPAASVLAEAIGDGFSEVRVLNLEPALQPEPSIEIEEEILGPEEFEALLLDGSATFEPSAPAPATTDAGTSPANSVSAPALGDLRSSGTWPKMDHSDDEASADAAATLQVLPVGALVEAPVEANHRALRAAPLRAPNPPRVAPPLPKVDTSAELAALRAELSRMTRQMRARDAYLQELEHALEHNRRELATAGFSTGLTAARLFGRMRGQAFRIAELEADLRQAQLSHATLRAAQQQAPASHAHDDLRAIKGIGPRFAAQLQELGFNSYASIASLSSDDMLRIATRLRISIDRIERDTWMEQAQALVGKTPRGTQS